MNGGQDIDWSVRCESCGVVFPMDKDIEDEVCPRCGMSGCLGEPRPVTFQPITDSGRKAP